MKSLLFIPFIFMCSMVIGQSSKIIGTPIKIGKLEVAQNNFPKDMNWNDAVKACANLGSGWRLPTKDELNLMYLNKDKIGGFASDYYWSSTEYVFLGEPTSAWIQGFSDGHQYETYKGEDDLNNPHYVRAVRTF